MGVDLHGLKDDINDGDLHWAADNLGWETESIAWFWCYCLCFLGGGIATAGLYSTTNKLNEHDEPMHRATMRGLYNTNILLSSMIELQMELQIESDVGAVHGSMYRFLESCYGDIDRCDS